MDERHVEASTCKFANDNLSDICTSDSKDAQIVKFPNPETLPDRKQVMHTLTLLQSASLLLYHKNDKICAKRLGRCKVFFAFAKQLENRDPQSILLQRNEETEIFNYRKFLKGDSLGVFCFHYEFFKLLIFKNNTGGASVSVGDLLSDPLQK